MNPSSDQRTNRVLHNNLLDGIVKAVEGTQSNEQDHFGSQTMSGSRHDEDLTDVGAEHAPLCKLSDRVIEPLIECESGSRWCDVSKNTQHDGST